MQRAASNIRTEANVLKDTVDGDGVDDLAAQQAATKAIGDLSNKELRELFVRNLRDLLENAYSIECARHAKQSVGPPVWRLRTSIKQLIDRVQP